MLEQSKNYGRKARRSEGMTEVQMRGGGGLDQQVEVMKGCSTEIQFEDGIAITCG